MLFPQGETRTNLAALLKYLLFLVLLVSFCAVVFHLIMVRIEGQQHSWITGFYWTLVVMTTLGFGDITFTSDIGRLFSMIVLLSGVVFLLVMLPFLFIRQFYAPWLESRMRLRGAEVPYFVVEPDPARAARLVAEGIYVIAGEHDSRGRVGGQLRAQRATRAGVGNAARDAWQRWATAAVRRGVRRSRRLVAR